MSAKTILIIEDDKEFQGLLKDILSQGRYRCLVAGNGKTGLEVARSKQPDLIFLDIELPDIDGYEVCGKLRANPALSRIPIIMCTVLAEPQRMVEGFKLGADDYITKPFDPDEVLARIDALFRQARAQRK